jgi:AcrR family transcriptional regulator
MMKRQDVIVALKLMSLSDRPWTHAEVADATALASAEIDQAIERLHAVGLVRGDRKSVALDELSEFLAQSLRYVFPDDGEPLYAPAVAAAAGDPRFAELVALAETFRRHDEDARRAARKRLGDLVRIMPRVQWKGRAAEDEPLATERAILEAAAELAAERGFLATGLRDIADRAGVNSSLISYHFGSKLGLQRKVLERLPQIAFEHLGPLVELGADATEQHFHDCLVSFLDRLGKDPEFHRLAIWAQCELDLGSDEALRGVFAAAVRQLGAALQARAGGSGDLDALCRGLSFMLLAEQYATVRWVYLRRLDLEAPLATQLLTVYRDMLAKDMLRLLLRKPDLGSP